ncbi:hypothetical protein [Nocardioides lianchengensis]|uniref:Uncharacterized protein n=1 Tax=Nocardioides lianchengensis TaxID=1045774 RepID=A0A1G6LSK0_9ACTN|nr:hypothetical protein [Nocardioides lianchengensis]NYG12461.1 hypothetical protein [Nocardioides lianchengensis]SDC46067.1 hypothetical protein SAMN05421872_102343 [Nocardioides lianchengensis]
MALTGLAAHVTKESIAKLLLGRSPDLLDEDVPEDRLDEWVRGVAAKVVPYVGTNPPEGAPRDIALDAIAYEVASEIEYSLFPEQQEQGNIGRGYHLHQKYLEMLAQLGTFPTEGPGVIPGPGPVGSFPPPEPEICW